jgi:hypothetical protein
MPNRPANGNTPMRLMPEFDKDPLRPKEHKILVETSPGQWTMIGKTTDPIELLKLEVGSNHAVGMQRDNVVIVGEDHAVEERYENYIPEPQPEGAALTERNRAMRDRWISSIIRWLLPTELLERQDSEGSERDVQNYLTSIGVAVSIRPDGNAVVIYRNDEPLSSWCAVQ